ncbi:MAG: hypothetical protein GKR88_12580 [Flavobacteriaceae bacterium]|nr:MAG: hypothetical protein GKR88_12580 [Flavobacteriaceae bacterium]
MNKKNKTYILLIAVAAVWGTIGYRIYSNMNPVSPAIQPVQNIGFKKIKPKQVDRIEIQPDYRDPFLGKIYKKKTPTRKKTPVKVKPAVVFPPIQFIGLIEGTTVSYIIEVNGHQEIFKIEQTFQQVTLKKAKDKNITIVYQGALKTISLKE